MSQNNGETTPGGNSNNNDNNDNSNNNNNSDNNDNNIILNESDYSPTPQNITPDSRLVLLPVATSPVPPGADENLYRLVVEARKCLQDILDSINHALDSLPDSSEEDSSSSDSSSSSGSSVFSDSPSPYDSSTSYDWDSSESSDSSFSDDSDPPDDPDQPDVYMPGCPSDDTPSISSGSSTFSTGDTSGCDEFSDYQHLTDDETYADSTKGDADNDSVKCEGDMFDYPWDKPIDEIVEDIIANISCPCPPSCQAACPQCRCPLLRRRHSVHNFGATQEHQPRQRRPTL